METTVTPSSKGQLALPKSLREHDALARSDVFRLQRLGSGKFLLEKLALPQRPRAALVRSNNGFLVFRPPRGSPRLTIVALAHRHHASLATLDSPLARTFASEAGLVSPGV